MAVASPWSFTRASRAEDRPWTTRNNGPPSATIACSAGASLSKLRGKELKWRNLPLSGQGEVLALPKTNTLEIFARVDFQTAKAVVLEFKSSDKNAQPITLGFNGSELAVMEIKAPLPLAARGQELELRVFIDRSVMEVFANETRCVTEAITPLAANTALAIHAEDGTAKAKLIEAWTMKTIW